MEQFFLAALVPAEPGTVLACLLLGAWLPGSKEYPPWSTHERPHLVLARPAHPRPRPGPLPRHAAGPARPRAGPSLAGRGESPAAGPVSVPGRARLPAHRARRLHRVRLREP